MKHENKKCAEYVEGMRKPTKFLHNHDIKRGHNSRKKAPLMRQP